MYNGEEHAREDYVAGGGGGLSVGDVLPEPPGSARPTCPGIQPERATVSAPLTCLGQQASKPVVPSRAMNRVVMPQEPAPGEDLERLSKATALPIQALQDLRRRGFILSQVEPEDEHW